MSEVLSVDEVATLKKLLAKAGSAVGAPPPAPRSMTPEQYDAHVAASNAETKRRAEYDENPRAAWQALAARVQELEDHLGLEKTPTERPAKA
jgi:hypothetical protein